MAKQPQRPNKLRPPDDADDDEVAADRQVRRFDSWQSRDLVLNCALVLLGMIILIGIAIATGLVKP